MQETAPHGLHGLGVVPSVLAVTGLALGLLTRSSRTASSPRPPRRRSPEGEVPHLALWHGLEPALGLSAITLVGGVALFLLRRPVEALQHRLAGSPSASGTYRAIMRGLDRVATGLTAGVQRGSLPYYLTVILSVFVAGALANLVLGGPWEFHVRFADSWGQVPVVIVMAVAAIAVLTAKTRFAAAVLVGVTGYGMSVLFVLHGAVDLALTQLVVETVTLIAFVLVLRRLPPRIATANPSRFRIARALFAALAGVTLAIVVIVAASARNAAPIWPDLPALTSSFGHGLNVVNVALVDLRGWDTLGELTVVVAAATGVASLIFLDSREDTLPRLRDMPASVAEDKHRPDGEPRAWLPTSAAIPTGRSALLDVVVRLLFHGSSCSLALPAVRRAQRGRRRLRRRPGRRHRPRAARYLAGGPRARCRRSGARRSPARARRRGRRDHRHRAAVLRQGGALLRVLRGDRPRPRPRRVRHRNLLRHRGVPGRRRARARRAPEPRSRGRPAAPRGLARPVADTTEGDPADNVAATTPEGIAT